MPQSAALPRHGSPLGYKQPPSRPFAASALLSHGHVFASSSSTTTTAQPAGQPSLVPTFLGRLSGWGVAKLGVAGFWVARLFPAPREISSSRSSPASLANSLALLSLVAPHASLQIYLCSVRFQLPSLLVSISGSGFTLGLLDFWFKTHPPACNILFKSTEPLPGFNGPLLSSQSLALYPHSMAPQIRFKALTVWLRTSSISQAGLLPMQLKFLTASLTRCILLVQIAFLQIHIQIASNALDTRVSKCVAFLTFR
ncbi:hypothetical protein C8R47DRAFT_1077498 [Mycena vitilis]|nr:hypothetical protein C8R47DRAFT_1077498 [Mycena vitilis]